jgi:F420-dependent oxidoreductase-like protein
MLVSVKLAPTFDYPVLERFWRAADELGFHGIWDYDHFYGLADPAQPTFEGWTMLAGMAVLTRNARIGCLVSSVTYRNPALLAKMAVTLDHMSAGRLEFGIGAGWHEGEHRGYGIEFGNPGARVEMLDEALTVIRRLWTDDAADGPVSFKGRFFTLDAALGNPKPLQQPHPPIVIGGVKPKMLRVIANHADEWNSPGQRPREWAATSAALDDACAEVGRDPSEIRRSVQLFLHPQQPEQVDRELESLTAYRDAGCQHVVVSFYQPPDAALLRRCAESS